MGLLSCLVFLPPCSAALAAVAGLSCPRILLCTFYPRSVQEHCTFSFTVNIVTALTNEKAPGPCLDLNAPFGSSLAFLVSEGLSLAAFKPWNIHRTYTGRQGLTLFLFFSFFLGHWHLAPQAKGEVSLFARATQFVRPCHFQEGLIWHLKYWLSLTHECWSCSSTQCNYQ